MTKSQSVINKGHLALAKAAAAYLYADHNHPSVPLAGTTHEQFFKMVGECPRCTASRKLADHLKRAGYSFLDKKFISPERRAKMDKRRK